MSKLLEKLAAANARIEQNDKKLADELKDVRRRAGEELSESEVLVVPESGLESSTLEGMASGPTREAIDSREQQSLTEETIVLRQGRPVLAILNDAPQLAFTDAESEVWRERLTDASAKLVDAARAVGRIEVAGHPSFLWLGTGWLVAPDIIVTNRHVAREFGRREGQEFVFKLGFGNRRMTATVDFLEEFSRPDSLEFSLASILHIEDDDGPDIAFLRVETTNRTLARHITLARATAASGQQVAVIGYPARDSRIPEQDTMERIFGNVYDKKRLAPGQVMSAERDVLRHDCSTLGGNSGSVVLDLDSGDAVALHFAGRFLEANFAVPAAVIDERLREVSRGGGPRRQRGGEISPVTPAGSDPAPALQATGTATQTCTVTIPLRIHVEIGQPVSGQMGMAALTVRADAAGARSPDSGDAPDAVTVTTEAKSEDYEDREGYQPDFLGPTVPLPEVKKAAADILTYERHGAQESVLRYQHFSVVMNERRRLCFFSAVNVDGEQSLSSQRGGWRTDPRIPVSAQIMKECYGNAPKFSRGHMTRREDPAWGSEEEAELGNSDSMHVTNTVPQMQSHNAGVWLELENYALKNARKDQMRISVFTGPVLRGNDPVMYGVKIPLVLWKVIVFIHDQTHKLCATGYTLSQEEAIKNEEFVYGAFTTSKHEAAQVPIRSIEQAAGISFGLLTELDPLASGEESMANRLERVSQIRFF